MDTYTNYKSFNNLKTIEELKYNLNLKRKNLLNLINEFEFYDFLLNASIYNPVARNLFETLESFSNGLESLLKKTKDLLNEIGMQIHQIDKKIECQDILCDEFFVKDFDDLDKKIFIHQQNTTDLKLQFAQYLQHVIRK